MRSRRVFLTAALWAALLAPPTSADGVREIDADCVAAGCFAGDAPGLPVTVATAGAYRLTSDLTLPDEDASGIEIAASFVDLDLAGFSIRGPVICGGVPTTCAPSGVGHGIAVATGGPWSDLRLHGGSVVGAGRNGIDLSACRGCRVEAMLLLGNAQDGLGAGTSEGLRLSRSFLLGNGRAGLLAGPRTTVASSLIADNGALFGAVTVGADSAIQGALVSDNRTTGISCSGPCRLSDNVIVGNGGSGVVASDASVQGNLVAASGGLGLQLTGAAEVSDNVILDNANLGLLGSAATGYGRNLLRGNFGGLAGAPQVSPDPTHLAPNLCGDDTVCP